jgi:uncharacterized damage-inducible protein DinB
VSGLSKFQIKSDQVAVELSPQKKKVAVELHADSVFTIELNSSIAHCAVHRIHHRAQFIYNARAVHRIQFVGVSELPVFRSEHKL